MLESFSKKKKKPEQEFESSTNSDSEEIIISIDTDSPESKKKKTKFEDMGLDTFVKIFEMMGGWSVVFLIISTTLISMTIDFKGAKYDTQWARLDSQEQLSKTGHFIKLILWTTVSSKVFF